MTGGEDGRRVRIDGLGYDYVERPKERVAACNLCGFEAHVEVARFDRYGYPAVFCVCARCGLGFLSPRLTPDEYADFYTHVYRPLVSAYHGRLIDVESVQVEQRDYAHDLIDFLSARVPEPPASVMDVGGSTGVVAAAVRDAFGSTATVLDPALDELAVAEAAGIETVAGFAEDYDPGGRRWELVLLCQTVDHLLDVAGTLATIRRMTANGGHAFVDVLDVSFMLRRRGQIESAVKIDHPYYLTRETAAGYFARTGLEITAERLSGDGHWGFLLRPGERREPDWHALSAAARRFLDEAWARRATASECAS